MTRQPLPLEAVLTRKRDLLAPYFTPRFLSGRTVLDLGAACGFYSYWALASGADRAVAVDIDDGCLGLIAQAKTLLDLERLTAFRANVAEWKEPADVVLALALVHWIYSCTAVLGSLDAVMAKLSSLTKYLLLVEWVEPNDPAIEFFQHTSWNRGLVHGPYTREAFEAALRTHYARYDIVGDVSATRRLYAAFASDHEIDLSGPLPLLLPKETVISSSCLTVVDGTPYWSRIYDAGDAIWKQATLDLAEREARFLQRLRGVHFPRALDVRTEPDFSVVTLEKIEGQPVTKVADLLAADREAFITFASG
ncbi:MAG: hypothetical protein FJZ97_05760, partial [Chloroflexi bacterium]|nr:hypothetical protein [Chloroflexota bacterium]